MGDLRRPLLGVETEQVAELRGKVKHFFHLAAVYDMTAPAERNTAVNVGGTTHAVELARAVDAKHLHHVSSIAVAGTYKGVFEEDMFDEGQKLPSPYHHTKFESERIVRDQPYVPWRVYRPAIVVGDSQTGEPGQQRRLHAGAPIRRNLSYRRARSSPDGTVTNRAKARSIEDKTSLIVPCGSR